MTFASGKGSFRDSSLTIFLGFNYTQRKSDRQSSHPASMFAQELRRKSKCDKMASRTSDLGKK